MVLYMQHAGHPCPGMPESTPPVSPAGPAASVAQSGSTEGGSVPVDTQSENTVLDPFDLSAVSKALDAPTHTFSSTPLTAQNQLSSEASADPLLQYVFNVRPVAFIKIRM